MQVNNLSAQCVPMGSGMGPRNGTGPRAQQLQQMQQNQIQQQQIQSQQMQNNQQLQQQVAMATGVGLNINLMA